MRTEEELKAELKTWVVKTSGKITADALTTETPLIETRILSSLQVMELILFLEKLKGGKLNMKAMKPGSFKNINGIFETFLRAP